MANYQIPLNGSNFINKDRQQAFQEALDDQHKIECQEQEVNLGTKAESSSPAPEVLSVKDYVQPSYTDTASEPAFSPDQPNGLDQALDYTYTHQARTMEIHQQYLAQQVENIQLITAVLNQQGKVLDSNSSAPQAEIIGTFQRTLDNFHAIREQSLSVHKDFLMQQAEFSERYLSFLENNRRMLTKAAPAAKKKASPPAEWVVSVPPIVLDEKPKPKQSVPTETAPAEPAHEVKLTQPVSHSTVTSEELSKALIHIVADKTGYPPEMLELNMDLEADLGIDSIKRVEILGALENEFPSLPPADTEVLGQTRTLQEIVEYMEMETSAPPPSTSADDVIAEPAASSPGPLQIEESKPVSMPARMDKDSLSVEDLSEILLTIVAEKTGYPVEMLESDMDMEADLGIDSIKRVEILGVMEERVPGLPSVEAEQLAELRTLGQIADLMSASQTTANNSPVEPGEKKKVKGVDLQNTPVQLLALPNPDRLEFQVPENRSVIVTNDGTSFTGRVVSELIADGWTVAVWDLPASLVPTENGKLPGDVHRIAQGNTGKEAINTALESFRADHGQPAGFIHLHPPAKQNGPFSNHETELVKQIFLVAGALKTDLEEIDQDSRSLFMTITRTDGALGLKNVSSFQEGSGLTGLVKSLNWEWPEVFCRAVDLSHDMDPQEASKLILQEIHDPDLGLLEVGRSLTSRVTLKREKE